MALWMESDRMGFLLSKVNQETFVTQQNVVQNEKRQGDNRAYSQVEYMMTKLMFPEGHPYSHTVIGSMEDFIKCFAEGRFLNFTKKYYSPGNATPGRRRRYRYSPTKAWIEQYFAEIKAGTAVDPLPKAPFKLNETKRSYYEDNLANAPQLTISFPTVEDFNKESYALEFFANIFAGTKKSPLYKVIVEERNSPPRYRRVKAGVNSREHLISQLPAFPNVKLGEVEDAVKEAFARFEKEGFSDKDVERQKAGLEYQFYNSITSVLGKARRLSDYNIFQGTPDYISTDFQNTMSVTKDGVMSAYQKYLKNQNYLILSLVPKGKPILPLPIQIMDRAGRIDR